MDGPGKILVKAMADTLPGYDMARALRGEAQMDEAIEQAGFMALHFSKTIGAIIDGEAPVPNRA